MIGQQIAVQGVAIRPGISKNGINYTAEELVSFAPSLTDKPILKDHRGEVDNTVGLVVKSGSNGTGVVNFSGWVKEDGTKLLAKIADKRIKEVSIGAFVNRLVRENDDDEHLTAIGIEAMELSLTPVPAVTGTSLTQALEMIEKKKTNEKIKVLPIYENVESFTTLRTVEETKEEKMSEDEPKKEETPVAPVEEPKKEETPKPEAETKPAAESKEVKVEQTAKVNIDVDTSKLNEAIEKTEKLLSLKKQLSESDKVIKEEKKPTTKGKVEKSADKTAAKESVSTELVVEKCEYGTGASLWRHPNADGSYKVGE